MKKNRGFTLMEMLIVVAIIAVLVGIAIPTMSNNLEKSREATDIQNLENAIVAVQLAADDDEIPSPNPYGIGYDKSNDLNAHYYYVEVTATQKKAGWQCDGDSQTTTINGCSCQAHTKNGIVSVWKVKCYTDYEDPTTGSSLVISSSKLQ